MNIYRPRPLANETGNDVHCRLTFANETDRKRFAGGMGFQGLAMAGPAAEAYHMTRAREFPGEESTPLGDLAAIGANLDPMAWSERALDVLLPQLACMVQVLPLEFPEGRYGLVNITHLVDGLDEGRSEIRYFSSGNLDRITRHVFKPERVQDQWIFKIPQTPRRAFVTDRFVERVRQAGLSGFDFELVWSDEQEVVAIVTR